MKKVINVVGYIRTATTEQTEEANYIKKQEAEIRKHCQQNNLNLLSIFFDAGVTGTNVKERMGFQEMLSTIENAKEVYGTEVNYVLVEKLSRLTRNTKDLVDTLNFLEGNNIFLKSIFDSIDTSTKKGKSFIHLSQIFFEVEQEFIESKKIVNEKGVDLL